MNSFKEDLRKSYLEKKWNLNIPEWQTSEVPKKVNNLVNQYPVPKKVSNALTKHLQNRQFRKAALLIFARFGESTSAPLTANPSLNPTGYSANFHLGDSSVLETLQKIVPETCSFTVFSRVHCPRNLPIAGKIRHSGVQRGEVQRDFAPFYSQDEKLDKGTEGDQS